MSVTFKIYINTSMCSCFTRDTKYKLDLNRELKCSCNLCGKTFDGMKDLIRHMGYHETDDMNKLIDRDIGTVSCCECNKSYKTVFYLAGHACS